MLKYQKQAKSERASFIINWVCKCKSNGVVTLGGAENICSDYSALALDCFLKNIGDAQTNTAATAILRSCKEKYPIRRDLTWDEILRDKEFQAEPLEVKKQVAENFFQRRIATEPEYQRLEPHLQERVKANFMRTIED